MSRKFSVIDYTSTSAFFRSCAYMRAAQLHSQLKWTDATRNDRVLDTVYTILAWKGRPGYVDVVRDERRIMESTDRFHEEYLRVYSRKLMSSPAAAAEYARQIGELREVCWLDLRRLVQEVNALSRGMSAEAGEAIRFLSKIQFASTVILNVVSIPYGPAHSLVATLHSIGVEWARSPSELGSSDVVMVAEKSATGMAGATAGAGGSALKSFTQQSEKLTWKVYEDLIKSGNPVHERILGSARRLQRAKFASGAVKAAGYGLSVVFAADSILSEWDRYQRDVAASKM